MVKKAILFTLVSFLLCLGLASANECSKAVELYNKATLSKDMEERERLFKDALALSCADNSILARIHNNLGDTYENTNRLAEAIAEYNKAVEIYPSLPTPYVSLGDVYSKMGNRERAKEYYERYWKLVSLKTRGQLTESLSPRSQQRSIIPVPKTDLYFGFDKATITKESTRQLKELLAAITGDELKMYTFELAGHTCDVGTDTYNRSLSMRRAQAVRKWLAAHGYPSTQLTTVGYGKSCPIADNATEKGRKLNRRVEIRTTGEIGNR